MRQSLQIAKVRGIPIRIHWSFAVLVLLVLVVMAGSGAEAGLTAALWLMLLFGSVVFHELAHSMVARRRGIGVRDIVLLPIGGVSEIPELARTPQDELHIALAGPLASLFLAAVLAVAGFLAGASLWPPSLTSGQLVAELAWVNVLLAAFNLLPALPMDGGRVLRAVLATRQGELQATTTAVRVGKVIGLAMVVLGVFVDVWLILIGLFVIFGAQSEGRAVAVHAALGNRRVTDLPRIEPFILPAQTSVADAVSRHLDHPREAIVAVVGRAYLGMVSPERLASAPPAAHIFDIADRSAPLIDPASSLYPTVLEAFAQSRERQLAVGTDGQIQGVISLADVESMLERSAAPGG